MKTTEKANCIEESDRPKNRYITLWVEAQKLYEKVYPLSSEQIIYDYTYLRDDEGLESVHGEETKTYETLVYMNWDVIWEIQSVPSNGEDGQYTIALISVTHNNKAGNPNFFDRPPSRTGENGKNLIATVSHDPDLKNKDDSYTIHFSITKGNNVPRTYKLDPRLKINQ